MINIKNKHLLIFLLLGAILILSFLLRSRIFLSKDFYFLVDQSRDMLLTKNVAIDHKITLIGARTGFGGLFHGPLWIYMLAPTFLLSGGNPFLTLVPIFLLVSIGTVLLGYWVGTKLYDFKTGLIFSFILSISLPLVSTVPFSTNAQVLPLIILLYLFFVIRFMRGEDKYLIFSLFVTGLGFQFESAFAFLLLPLTIMAIVLRKSLPKIRESLLGVLAFVLPLSSFVIFDLRHRFLMLNSFIRLFTVHIKPLPGFERYDNLSFRIVDRLQAFINSLYSPLFDQNQLMKIFIILILILGLFLSIYRIAKTRKIKQDEREYLFLLLSPIIIFGIYILYPLPLWPHYLLPVSIFVIFLTTVTLVQLLKYRLLKLLVILFLILSSVAPTQWIYKEYFVNKSSAISSDGSYQNQLEAARWVLGDAKGQGYGYFEYSPGILTYNMDYLMWWINKNEGKQSPLSLKEPITYLIMFPSASGDIGAHDFWKKNVLHTKSRVIESKVFSSGITVEKLSINDGEENVDPNYYQNLIFR